MARSGEPRSAHRTQGDGGDFATPTRALGLRNDRSRGSLGRGAGDCDLRLRGNSPDVRTQRATATTEGNAATNNASLREGRERTWPADDGRRSIHRATCTSERWQRTVHNAI